jgi:pimeloyl-ACP methyl ester carboxylesterase
MWLRDWMPRELKGARSIIYGYDSKLAGSESFQDVDEIVHQFVQLLEINMPPSFPPRPIVLLGHSMGGIVIKHALTKMNDKGNEEQKKILDRIKGVVFFGVPNRGMEISHYLAMAEGRPNDKLVRRLGKDSKYLENLDKMFFEVALRKRIRLISLFETLQSPKMQIRSHWVLSDRLGKGLMMNSKKKKMALGPKTVLW